MSNRAALLRSQYGNAVSRSGRHFIEFDLGGNQRRLVATIERLHYGALADREIDTGWRTETGTGWDWVMDHADYKVQARSILNAGNVIQWTDPQTGENVTLQPLALNWVNNVNDSRQQITQPQAVAAVASDDVLTWINGYGAGRHFRYTVHPQRLVKHLIIDSLSNLPTATVANPYLELEFILSKSAGVTLYVDGVAWDNSTRVATANSIEFRTSSGEVLWFFEAPGADDSAGDHTTGIFQLRRQGANRYCTVRIPKTWIDSAVFPIYLDPTFTDGYGQSVDSAFDGRVNEGSVNANYATSVTVTLFGGAGSRASALFKFDVSSIPSSATIDSATFSIYNISTATGNRTFSIYSILAANSGWVEGCTWNYANPNTVRWAGDVGSNGGTDAGCSVSNTDFAAAAIGSGQYTANDVAGTEEPVSLSTSTVGTWRTANYGMIMSTTEATTSVPWATSDNATTGYRPKLVVVYTEAAAGMGITAIAGRIRRRFNHLLVRSTIWEECTQQLLKKLASRLSKISFGSARRRTLQSSFTGS